MLIEQQNPANSELDDWAIQSEFWISQLPKLQKHRRRRQRNSNPIILAGHGNSLRIDKGTLVIKEGFTHHPQKQIKHRYYPGDLKLPRTIILLDGSGSLSFDVLSWLSEQDTSLVRIKWDGSIAIAATANGFAANQSKVDWQRNINGSIEKRIAFASELISQKLQNSIPTLEKFVPKSDLRDSAIAKAQSGIEKLSVKLTDMQEVRAIEAVFGATYFRSWSAVKLDWKHSPKYPVPEHWLSYSYRSSLRDAKATNFGASDPVNAMLNYAYAILQSKLQIAAIADGFDPTIGIMHHAQKNNPAYVFDLMEPERPKVDAKILEFVSKMKFSGADFTLNKSGVCRISPQLARAVATLVN